MEKKRKIDYHTVAIPMLTHEKIKKEASKRGMFISSFMEKMFDEYLEIKGSKNISMK